MSDGPDLRPLGQKRTWILLALWAICLSPTWGSIAAFPETFWQGAFFGCSQVWAGLLAVIATVFLLEI